MGHFMGSEPEGNKMLQVDTVLHVRETVRGPDRRPLGQRHYGFAQVTAVSPDNDWIDVRPLFQGDASVDGDGRMREALGVQFMDMSPIVMGEYCGPSERLAVVPTIDGRHSDYIFQDVESSGPNTKTLSFSVWNGKPVATMQRRGVQQELPGPAPDLPSPDDDLGLEL